MLNKIQALAEERMKKSVGALAEDLAKLRTGRAHPSLLDSIMVEYYGTASPLNQVANVTVSDARTLVVTPWDKSTVQAIDKAIRSSDLGLNPATSGMTIRVPLPPLTEERRKTLIKHVHSEAEMARVAIRNIRRESNSAIKDLLKNKAITEDEERKSQEGIQKLTDRFVGEIDKLVASKEAELMHI